MVSPVFDSKDIQGNILRGYRMNVVRYLMLEVTDRMAARTFLGISVAGGNADVPGITSETPWGTQKPDVCFNIGLTFEGLRALGVAEDSLASFPTEFKMGMTSRALKLGDFGASAPDKWPKPFDRPDRLHLIASIYALDATLLDRVEAQVARAFTVRDRRDGRNLADNKVFFGHADNISQPRFAEIRDPAEEGVDEPVDPLGTVLLGYPTRLEGLMFGIPSPDVLGFNGTFNAFRVLAQDSAGFEAWLDKAADELFDHPRLGMLLTPGEENSIGPGLDSFGALREIVAGQMCGRWRNGTPMALSPDAQWLDPEVSLTNFDYDRVSRCPVGSHVRRTNPRGGQIVQRIANYTRRLVRRGMSYGPDFDPAHPDDRERGLLGNFIGASLGAQFEAVMCDWLNLGLHDPRVTGSNDPLIGANTPETSWFDLSLRDGSTIRLSGFPRFVHARGGAYTFLPSLPAIDYLSKMTS